MSRRKSRPNPLTHPPAGDLPFPADQRRCHTSDVMEFTGFGEDWVYEKFAVECPPKKMAGKLVWPVWKVLAYLEEQPVR